MRFQVKAKTKDQLKAQSEPQYTPGGQSEAIPHIFHDIDTYVSTTTTELTFFRTTRANRFLSNLSPAGMLPDANWFEVFAFTYDVVIAPETAGTQVDTAALLWGSGATGVGNPIFTFTLQDKTYGPWTLSALHGTGGITGFGAVATNEYANNATPDGGFWVDGAVTIPPQAGFGVTIQWPAALTLTASCDVKVCMIGVLHRAVK